METTITVLSDAERAQLHLGLNNTGTLTTNQTQEVTVMWNVMVPDPTWEIPSSTLRALSRLNMSKGEFDDHVESLRPKFVHSHHTTKHEAERIAFNVGFGAYVVKDRKIHRNTKVEHLTFNLGEMFPELCNPRFLQLSSRKLSVAQTNWRPMFFGGNEFCGTHNSNKVAYVHTLTEDEKAHAINRGLHLSKSLFTARRKDTMSVEEQMAKAERSLQESINRKKAADKRHEEAVARKFEERMQRLAKRMENRRRYLQRKALSNIRVIRPAKFVATIIAAFLANFANTTEEPINTTNHTTTNVRSRKVSFAKTTKVVSMLLASMNACLHAESTTCNHVLATDTTRRCTRNTAPGVYCHQHKES